MTDTERDQTTQRIVLAIAGQTIRATDPWVTFCGWCGRRLEACQADRRDAARCDEDERAWPDQPPTR